MQIQQVNLCPTCIYTNTCVLTHNQSSVTSCSDYNEAEKKPSPSTQKTQSGPVVKPKRALELV